MSQAGFGSNQPKEGIGMNSVIMSIEATLIVATALAITIAAVGQQMGSPEFMFYAAVFAGSIGGAACSLMVKPAETQRASLFVFGGNAMFGLTFGGMATDLTCQYFRLSPTFQSGVAISGAMSGFVSMLVWVVAPKLLQWAVGADWPTIVMDRLGLQKKTDGTGK